MTAQGWKPFVKPWGTPELVIIFCWLAVKKRRRKKDTCHIWNHHLIHCWCKHWLFVALTSIRFALILKMYQRLGNKKQVIKPVRSSVRWSCILDWNVSFSKTISGGTNLHIHASQRNAEFFKFCLVSLAPLRWTLPFTSVIGSEREAGYSLPSAFQNGEKDADRGLQNASSESCVAASLSRATPCWDSLPQILNPKRCRPGLKPPSRVIYIFHLFFRSAIRM